MLIEHLQQRLHERQTQLLWRTQRVAESPSAPWQRIAADTAHTNSAREMLAFCSNDYLGLANHSELIDALAEGARLYGAGSGASHLISGHSRAHALLEDELAACLAPQIPDARVLSFCTGYMANLALLTALGGANATVFADKLNHASLVDGALLAKVPLKRYAHRNLEVLERELERCTTPIKLIATDAVFSMDGSVADLDQLLALAERFDAWLIVDDAHGFGVLGPQGRGTAAHFGLRSERLIVMGTLGKALGIAGAFVAADPTIIMWLMQTARTYIYTTASPPALAHALRTSLKLAQGPQGDERRRHLTGLIQMLRQQITALLADHADLNWQLAESTTPIQPLIVGDNHMALAVAQALEDEGLRIPAIRPPTVPVGTARLRITLSAAHQADDVNRLTSALQRVMRRLP